MVTKIVKNWKVGTVGGARRRVGRVDMSNMEKSLMITEFVKKKKQLLMIEFG